MISDKTVIMEFFVTRLHVHVLLSTMFVAQQHFDPRDSHLSFKDGAYYCYCAITFCASRDTRVSYGWCLLIQEYFCAV